MYHYEVIFLYNIFYTLYVINMFYKIGNNIFDIILHSN
jgi:hypothetical protein